MAVPQGDLGLLKHPVAQELLASKIPARLAYVWTDGTPRVIPIWYHWNGREFVPVKNLKIAWASASNQPTTLSFDPVSASQIRLTMTSPSPGTAAGFLTIAELTAGNA